MNGKMWGLEWLRSVFHYFLWGGGKQFKIVFLGLDNAGKTTLIHMLKNQFLVQHMPTRHPSSALLQTAGFSFRAFDLGGHRIARTIWKDYLHEIDGVVYVVDSNDRAR